jgi:SAM-dependent methyltransferase
MDRATLLAYDSDPDAFANLWETQPLPGDFYALLLRFFRAGKTADIGCGSGRDAAWLLKNGFDVIGYDASRGLLAQARARHAGVEFAFAELPDLAGVERAAFQNVVCETVIMHLPIEEIVAAVKTLMALLVPAGTLYLSWRVSQGDEERDKTTRLFSAFAPQLVQSALGSSDTLLWDKEEVSASSGRTIHRLIVRKGIASESQDSQLPPNQL